MADKLFKVLLIEDNAGDARLMQEMLAESGAVPFQLEWVDRLSKGLERLKSGDVHVVLLDLSLPDSQGWDTFSKVQAEAGRVPIVVLSGLDDEELAIKTVQAGAQDYLVKSRVDGHSLVRALRYAIERRWANEQLEIYARLLRQKNEQMAQELTMARELQLAMLPHQFPNIPRDATLQNSALRFFSFYYPSGPVSGDFFDVMAISDASVGVFICDVMGHDVRAALVTGMMRALVEQLSTVAVDPAQLLTQINRGLFGIFKHTGITMYATAFYLVADVAKGSVWYSNGGHPSPFHLDRGKGTVEPMEAPGSLGPALGLFDDAVYTTIQRPLAVGDLIMLFTDGLFEIEAADHIQYSRESLLADVRERLQMPAADLFSELLTKIRLASPKKEFADDVCLVGMEIVRLS
jgi:phosphoserine phosphatase RsbU/P